MKKSFVFGFVLFTSILIVSSFVFAATTDIEANLKDNIQAAKELQGTVKEYSSAQAWEERLDYLGNQWKEFFLRNKYISYVDSFFNEMSIVFLILFAKPYSLSLLLFGIFVLWLIAFIRLSEIIRAWGIVGGRVYSYLASLAICIALSWIKLFETVILLVTRLVLSPEHVWTRILLIVCAIAVFIFMNKLSSYASKLLGGRRADMLRNSAELSGKKIQSFAQGMEKATNQIDEEFDYSKGMRRGGEKGNKSRFVSKAAVERYAKIYGGNAARKRFGI